MYDMSVNDLYRKYHILPAVKLHEFRVLLLVHKFIHNKDKLPSAFKIIPFQITLSICMTVRMILTLHDTFRSSVQQTTYDHPRRRS